MSRALTWGEGLISCRADIFASLGSSDVSHLYYKALYT